MKMRTLAALAASLFVAGQAQAIPQLVVGFDFSQSCLAGNLCDAGFNPIQTLPGNYSDLDPNGLGVESASFGTMFLDGTNGSSSVPGFGGVFNPTSPDLTLNTAVHRDFPLTLGAAGNQASMQAEIPGVAYQAHSMYATDTVNAVFKADLSSVPLEASMWEVSFAALSDGTSSVAVSFSEDGVNYTTPTVEGLGTAEEVVAVSYNAASGIQMLFVKLGFLGTESDSRIDNLAIKAELVSAPEPGTVLLLLSGLGGLAVFGRRRA